MAQSILFMGTESESQVGNLANAVNSNGGNEWADRAYTNRKTLVGSMALGTALTGNLGDIAEAWFSYRIGGTISSAGQNKTIIQFRNASGQGILRIQNGASNVKTFAYWNGSSWISIGTLTNADRSKGRKIVLHCKIANSGGRFACYVDGQLQFEMTGDTDLFAGSSIRDVQWVGEGQFNATQYAECIVSTESPLKGRVYSGAPTGDGTNTAWSGTFADVDEISSSTATIDADDISAASAGDIETFTTTAISSAFAAGKTIRAVAVACRARNNGGGGDVELCLRSGGTNYFGAHSAAIGSAFSDGFYHVWNTNPNGGGAWTLSDVNALEFGVRAITAGSVDVSKVMLYVYFDNDWIAPWDDTYPVDPGFDVVSKSFLSASGTDYFIDVISPDLASLNALPKFVMLEYGAYTPNTAEGTAKLSRGLIWNSPRAELTALVGMYSRATDASATSSTRANYEGGALGSHNGGGQDNFRLLGQPDSDNTLDVEFAEFIPGGVRLYVNTMDNNIDITATFYWGDDLDIALWAVGLGTGTSAIAVTGLGFEPTAMLAFYNTKTNNDCGMSMGCAVDDGSLVQRSIQRQSAGGQAAGGTPAQQFDNAHIGGRIATNGTQAWLLTLNSFDSDGFTVTPSASTSSTTMFFLAMASKSGKKFKLLDLTTPTSTGVQSITGAGFEPSLVVGYACSIQAVNTIASDTEPASSMCQFRIGPDLTQACDAISDDSTADPTDTYSYHDKSHAIRIGTNGGIASVIAEALSLDSDGFSLNYTTVAGTAKLGFALLIEGIPAPDPPSNNTGTGLIFVVM